MVDSHLQRPRFHDADEPEVIQYQAVSGLAVGALVAGLLSFVAMFHPALWFVPVVGAVVSVIALRRVAAFAPALVGRKAALLGLALSAIAAAAAVTHWCAYRKMLRDEARGFATMWFDDMADNKPERAYQYTLHPFVREPITADMWPLYASSGYWRRNLEEFVTNPSSRLLLALGNRASVRYYDTESYRADMADEVLEQVYAVTYETQQGEKQTFFVRMKLHRVQDDRTGHGYWYLASFTPGIRPVALTGEDG